jgi:predicted MFS family arabinose efflux permease
MDLLPAVVLGFLLAPLLDRLNRKRILVGSELAGCVLFLSLVFLHGLVALMIVAALTGVASSLFIPGLSAALPRVVPDEALGQANALVRSVSSSAILVGPPLAGILVAVGGTGAVFAINGISYLISALLLSRIPRASLQAPAEPDDEAAAVKKPGSSHWQRAKFGLNLFRPAPLRSILVSWSVVCVSLSGINVCEVLIAKRVFHVGDTGFGILAACSGAGMLVGSLLSGWLSFRHRPEMLYVAGLLLAAAGISAAALAPWFGLTLALFAIGAIGNTLSLTTMQLLLQRNLPEESSGQGFGVFSSCTTACSVVGLLLAGPAADQWGARAVWLGAGLLLAAGGGLAFLLAGPRSEADLPLLPATLAGEQRAL